MISFVFREKTLELRVAVTGATDPEKRVGEQIYVNVYVKLIYLYL